MTLSTLEVPVELPCTTTPSQIVYEVEVISGLNDIEFMTIEGTPTKVKVNPANLEMNDESVVKTMIKISSTVGADTISTFFKFTLF